MTPSNPSSSERTVVMDADAIAQAVRRMAQEIVADNPDVDSLALLGILSRGRPLADRIAEEIGAMTGKTPRVGSLATTLYRDDLRSGRVDVGNIASRATHFDFDIDGITVVLVDDVLSTGRTVRAAMDEAMDYGRPRRIQLAGLVDRGLRELPIRGDYIGWALASKSGDHVSVKLREIDGEDVALLERAVGDEEGGE